MSKDMYLRSIISEDKFEIKEVQIQHTMIDQSIINQIFIINEN